MVTSWSLRQLLLVVQLLRTTRTTSTSQTQLTATGRILTQPQMLTMHQCHQVCGGLRLSQHAQRLWQHQQRQQQVQVRYRWL
jgi:hypothetical protein